MKKYQFTDEQGRTIELEGEGMPSESDISAAFAVAFKAAKPKPLPDHPASNFQPKYTPERSAGASDIMWASLAESPEYRAKYYAKQMGIPEDRIAVDNGIPSYKAQDGQWYYFESPDLLPQSFGQAGDLLARIPGPMLSDVPPAVAGVATAPMWLGGPGGAAASLGVTGAVAGGASALRQELAEKFTGQPFDSGRVGRDFALNTLAEGIGGLAIKSGTRGLARDIDRLDLAARSELQAKANELGIDLTPAELTGLGSLAAEQKRLGNVIDSQTILEDFYLNRLKQIEGAVANTLGRISPDASPELVGREVIQQSKQAIQGAKDARKKVSAPFYRSVMDNPDNILNESDMAGIMTGPNGLADDYMPKVFERVMNDPKFNADIKGLPSNHIKVVDAVKRFLDSERKQALRSGDDNAVRVSQARITRLRDIADSAIPSYPEARAAYAGMSPDVEALQNSMIGVLASLKETKAKDAVKKLLSATNIRANDVRFARDAILKTEGGAEVWQKVKRSWIEDAWAQSSKRAMNDPDNIDRGGKFAKILLDDPRQRENLMAALTPSEFKAIEDLQQVLQAASRVKKIGSDTEWNRIVEQAARDKAQPWISKALANINPAQLLRTSDSFFSERAYDKYSKRMAEIITTPALHGRLKELNQMSPGSAKFRVAVPLFLLGASNVAGQQVDQ